MIRLLKIELQKIIYSRQVWIILGLYILLIIPVAYAIDSISLGGSSNGEAMPGGMAINFFNFPFIINVFLLIYISDRINNYHNNYLG